LLMRQGTIPGSSPGTDATIIAAAPSTKNKRKARDPETRQPRKGNQWHFGMPLDKLGSAYRGRCRLGDGAYGGRHRRQQSRPQPEGGGAARRGGSRVWRCRRTGADKRHGLEDRDVAWNIAVKRGVIKALPKAPRDRAEAAERAGAGAGRGRAPVPHRREPVPP
jgi:transposase, IS5 family